MEKNNPNLHSLMSEVRTIIREQKDRSVAHDFSHIKRVYKIAH